MLQVQEEAGLMITMDHEGSLREQMNGDARPVKPETTPSKRPRGRPRKNAAVVVKPVRVAYFVLKSGYRVRRIFRSYYMAIVSL